MAYKKWSGWPELHPDYGHAGHCEEHGKACFRSKKIARRHAARKQVTHHCSVYRCETTDMWHVGGVPRAVMQGVTTRGEFYEKRAA